MTRDEAAQAGFSYVSQCNATVEAEGGTYTCTREKGHQGPHVAHIRIPVSYSPVASWTTQEDLTEH